MRAFHMEKTKKKDEKRCEINDAELCLSKVQSFFFSWNFLSDRKYDFKKSFSHSHHHT